MERLGDLTWKQYYLQDRKMSHRMIDECILNWKELDDDIVNDILEKGGALSFPHTYLGSSLEPLVRTAAAIVKMGFKHVIALGVFHRISNTEDEEFSLDNFQFILKRTCSLYEVDMPRMETIFLPKVHFDEKEPIKTIENIRKDVHYLRQRMGPGTVIIMTGDLCHYGNAYGLIEPEEDPEQDIMRSIREGLKMIYEVEDLVQYILQARSNNNDQWAVAVALKTMFEKRMEWRIISSELTDYSVVLQAKKPCLVASIFYGAYPKI